VAGVLLLAVVRVFLLRYVPEGAIHTRGPAVPNRSDLVAAFAPRAAWAMVFLAVFGLVGGWWLAGRMLSPLDRITAATRQAATGSLSHRIRLEGRADEFGELADAFDTMLARLEAHVEEQRRFAANASHELRTPLATTQALLDVARADPARVTDPQWLERLHTVNARAIELTEALLLMSRAEQRSFTTAEVDLSLLAEEAAETLLPLAERRGVSIEVSGHQATVQGSPPLLLQLVTNLLHNAVVHNVADGGVWVTVARTHAAVALTVENTGDPLSPNLVATLTEPFQRGTQRVRSDHAGVGLGLAIASRIVQAHDGALELRPREGGGLVATVRLPAARREESGRGSAFPGMKAESGQ
jgi:two-component system sensor histidine kinase VanS